MLAQLKWLIDLLRARTGPIDPKRLKVSMTSLHYEWEQLERIFGHARRAANEATLITDEDERALFDNWLNHQQRYIDAGRNAFHTVLGFYYDQKEITQAELRMVSDNLKKLLKASKFKYNEIIDSSGFSDRAGRSLIESYLNQLIDVLEAPRQRTSPVILDDVDEPFSAARAGIQLNIDRKLSELVRKGRRSYSCFLSYAWGNATHEAIVAHVAKLLDAVGIRVHFDRWADVPGKRIQDFVAKIDSSDWVVIFGSQLYQQKYKRRATSMSDQEHVVRAEAQIMNKIAMSSTKRAQTVIPVLLEGTNQTALPQPFLNDHIAINLSEGDYVAHVIRLIKTLYKLPLDDVSSPEPVAVTARFGSSSTEASSSAAASSSSAASSDSVSDVNFTPQARVIISKAVRQAFNLTGVSQTQGIRPSVIEQMDRNRDMLLKVIELLCNEKVLEQETAEPTLQHCLENLGNTSFASALIQTEQGDADYDKRLAAAHAMIVRLFKGYQHWRKNITGLACVALRSYHVPQRYSTDRKGEHTEYLTAYINQWLAEKHKPSLVVLGEAGGGKSLLTLDWEQKLWAEVPPIRWIDVGVDQLDIDSYETKKGLVVWHYAGNWLLTYRSGERILELNIADLKRYEFAQILMQESYQSLRADEARLAEVTYGLQCYWLLKERQRIPFRIPLGDYTSETVQDCIRQQLQRLLDIDDESIGLLKSYVHFLFLLDGYDEIKVKKGLFKVNLYRSNGLSSWSAKALFTCRSQYFNSPGMSTACFNVAYTGAEHKLYLAPFESVDIANYIELYASANGLENRDEILTSITEYEALKELLATPLLLNLYIRSYVHGAQPLKTRWALYQHLMSQLFNRQALKEFERQLSRSGEPEELAAMYDDASAELAFALFVENKEALSKSPRPYRRGPQVLANAHESPLFSFFSGNDAVQDALRRGHPFKRTPDGKYSFIHESIKEFFIAKYLFSDLEDAVEFESAQVTWNAKLLPEVPVILQFLREAIEAQSSEAQHRLKTHLWSWVTLKTAEYSNCSANSATLLVQLKEEFSSIDLSHTYLRGANLSGGVFESTNFVSADCHGVNFNNAQLNNANFSNALLTDSLWSLCPIFKLKGSVKAISSMNVSAIQVVTVDGSNTYLWDGATGEQLASLEGSTGSALCLSFSPDGVQLACGYEDGTIRLWDVAGRRHEATLEGHTGTVLCLSYSADGLQLASGSRDRTIRLWNVAGLYQEATLAGHTGTVLCLSYSADCLQLASGSHDGTIRLWDVAGRRHEATLEGHTDWVLCLSYRADGLQLASGSRDRTIRLWNVAGRCHEATLEGHTKRVRCLSYSADSLQLASGSYDRTVRLWNLDSHYDVKVLPQEEITSIASLFYLANGRDLIIGSNDGILCHLYPEGCSYEMRSDMNFSVTGAIGLGSSKVNLEEPEKLLENTDKNISCNLSIALEEVVRSLKQGRTLRPIENLNVYSSIEIEEKLDVDNEHFSEKYWLSYHKSYTEILIFLLNLLETEIMDEMPFNLAHGLEATLINHLQANNRNILIILNHMPDLVCQCLFDLLKEFRTVYFMRLETKSPTKEEAAAFLASAYKVENSYNILVACAYAGSLGATFPLLGSLTEESVSMSSIKTCIDSLTKLQENYSHLVYYTHVERVILSPEFCKLILSKSHEMPWLYKQIKSVFSLESSYKEAFQCPDNESCELNGSRQPQDTNEDGPVEIDILPCLTIFLGKCDEFTCLLKLFIMNVFSTDQDQEYLGDIAFQNSDGGHFLSNESEKNKRRIEHKRVANDANITNLAKCDEIIYLKNFMMKVFSSNLNRDQSDIVFLVFYYIRNFSLNYAWDEKNKSWYQFYQKMLTKIGKNLDRCSIEQLYNINLAKRHAQLRVYDYSYTSSILCKMLPSESENFKWTIYSDSLKEEKIKKELAEVLIQAKTAMHSVLVINISIKTQDDSYREPFWIVFTISIVLRPSGNQVFMSYIDPRGNGEGENIQFIDETPDKNYAISEVKSGNSLMKPIYHLLVSLKSVADNEKFRWVKEMPWAVHISGRKQMKNSQSEYCNSGVFAVYNMTNLKSSSLPEIFLPENSMLSLRREHSDVCMKNDFSQNLHSKIYGDKHIQLEKDLIEYYESDYFLKKRRIETNHTNAFEIKVLGVNVGLVKSDKRFLGVTEAGILGLAEQGGHTSHETALTDEPFLLDKLFALDEPISYVIQGQAGIGKSCLCKYIVSEFVKTKQSERTRSLLMRFQLIWWLPLEEFKNIPIREQRDPTPFELLYLHYEYVCNSILMRTPLDWNDFKVVIEQLAREKRILILIDSYEEVQHLLQPKSPFYNALEALYDKCENKILLSRPYALIGFPFRYKNLLAITGFDRADVRNYINNYFDSIFADKSFSETKANCKKMILTLNKYLDGNERISKLCHVPARLQLICKYWSHQGYTSEPATVALFFRDLVSGLLCRNEKFYQDNPSPEKKEKIRQKIEKYLYRLAFKNCNNDEEHFVLCLEAPDYIETSAIILPIDKTKKMFKFAAPVLKEYFLATYLAQAIGSPADKAAQKQAKKFVKNNKYKFRYLSVFRFIVCLFPHLYPNNDEIQLEYWQCLFSGPKDMRGFHVVFMVICGLEEYLVYKKDLLPIHDKLLARVEEWLKHIVQNDSEYARIFLILMKDYGCLYERIGREILENSIISSDTQLKSREIKLLKNSMLCSNLSEKNHCEIIKRIINSYCESDSQAQSELKSILDKLMFGVETSQIAHSEFKTKMCSEVIRVKHTCAKYVVGEYQKLRNPSLVNKAMEALINTCSYVDNIDSCFEVIDLFQKNVLFDRLELVDQKRLIEICVNRMYREPHAFDKSIMQKLAKMLTTPLCKELVSGFLRKNLASSERSYPRLCSSILLAEAGLLDEDSYKQMLRETLTTCDELGFFAFEKSCTLLEKEYLDSFLSSAFCSTPGLLSRSFLNSLSCDIDKSSHLIDHLENLYHEKLYEANTVDEVTAVFNSLRDLERPVPAELAVETYRRLLTQDISLQVAIKAMQYILNIDSAVIHDEVKSVIYRLLNEKDIEFVLFCAELFLEYPSLQISEDPSKNFIKNLDGALNNSSLTAQEKIRVAKIYHNQEIQLSESSFSILIQGHNATGLYQILDYFAYEQVVSFWRSETDNNIKLELAMVMVKSLNLEPAHKTRKREFLKHIEKTLLLPEMLWDTRLQAITLVQKSSSSNNTDPWTFAKPLLVHFKSFLSQNKIEKIFCCLMNPPSLARQQFRDMFNWLAQNIQLSERVVGILKKLSLTSENWKFLLSNLGQTSNQQSRDLAQKMILMAPLKNELLKDLLTSYGETKCSIYIEILAQKLHYADTGAIYFDGRNLVIEPKFEFAASRDTLEVTLEGLPDLKTSIKLLHVQFEKLAKNDGMLQFDITEIIHTPNQKERKRKKADMRHPPINAGCQDRFERYDIKQLFAVKTPYGDPMGPAIELRNKVIHHSFRDFLKKHLFPYCKEKSELFKAVTEHWEIDGLRLFLSYAWAILYHPDYATQRAHEVYVQKIAKDLACAGFLIYLDRYEDRKGKILTKFIEKMELADFNTPLSDSMPRKDSQSDYILPICTPLYLWKYLHREELFATPDKVVRFEVTILNHIARYNEQQQERIIPFLLSGSEKASIPFMLQTQIAAYFVQQDYHKNFFELVKSLYRLSPTDKGFKQLEQEFYAIRRELADIDLTEEEQKQDSARKSHQNQAVLKAERAKATYMAKQKRKQRDSIMKHGALDSITLPETGDKTLFSQLSSGDLGSGGQQKAAGLFRSSLYGSESEEKAITTAKKQSATIQPSPTMGGGDCAVHALLGRWDSIKEMYVCVDVNEKRERVSEIIKSDASSVRYHDLILSSIQCMIMNAQPTGKHIQELYVDYIYHIDECYRDSPLHWQVFESLLKQHSDILEYVNSKLDLSHSEDSLRNRFYSVLSNSDALYAMILSIPELSAGFDTYNAAVNVKYDWKSKVTASHFNEYADFISKPSQWMLVTDLTLIARIFGITVKYYASRDSECDLLNKGQTETVSIVFNGRDHYERYLDPADNHAYSSATDNLSNRQSFWPNKPSSKKVQIRKSPEDSYPTTTDSAEQNDADTNSPAIASSSYSPTEAQNTKVHWK
jgi:WD40 repeat protein